MGRAGVRSLPSLPLLRYILSPREQSLTPPRGGLCYNFVRNYWLLLPFACRFIAGADYTEVLMGMSYASLVLGTAETVAGTTEASSGACMRRHTHGRPRDTCCLACPQPSEPVGMPERAADCWLVGKNGELHTRTGLMRGVCVGRSNCAVCVAAPCRRCEPLLRCPGPVQPVSGVRVDT